MQIASWWRLINTVAEFVWFCPGLSPRPSLSRFSPFYYTRLYSRRVSVCRHPPTLSVVDWWKIVTNSQFIGMNHTSINYWMLLAMHSRPVKGHIQPRPLYGCSRICMPTCDELCACVISSPYHYPCAMVCPLVVCAVLCGLHLREAVRIVCGT